VVNFWATWCQPCAAENPIFAALARRYAGRARFISVIYQDTPQAIRTYERLRGSWGPALVDPDSRTAIQYGVYGVPETFLIDAQGLVHEKVTGMVSFDGLTRALESMLAARNPGEKL
jgi:cytochrome c biogenesis protein CcmG/thiol:disulfide interchange protein DsbE